MMKEQRACLSLDLDPLTSWLVGVILPFVQGPLSFECKVTSYLCLTID